MTKLFNPQQRIRQEPWQVHETEIEYRHFLDKSLFTAKVRTFGNPDTIQAAVEVWDNRHSVRNAEATQILSTKLIKRGRVASTK